MNGVNMVIVVGRLGDDPETRYTKDGTAVTNITLAVNERWNGKDGQKQERVEWIKVVLWGKLGEVAKEYLNKGDAAYVRGKLQTRNWEDKQGVKRYTTEVRADELQLMGGRKDAGGGGGDRAKDRDRGDTRGDSHSDHGGYSDDSVPF